MIIIEKKSKTFHHGKLEECLILQGLKLIKDRNDTDFSLREVSNSLGVSHAAAYRHFKSKSDLIAQIAIRGFGLLSRELEDVIFDYKNHGNTYRALLDLGHAYIDFGIKNPALYRVLFTKENMDCSNLDELEIARNRTWQPLVNVIKQGQHERKIQNLYDAIDISTMLWASIHGYVLLCIEMNIGNNGLPSTKPHIPKAKFLEMIHQSIWK